MPLPSAGPSAESEKAQTSVLMSQTHGGKMYGRVMYFLPELGPANLQWLDKNSD